MAEADAGTVTAERPPDTLLTFALATFHVSLLGAVALVILHSSGSVGRLLVGLDTAAGLLLFLALWGITWWTTRWVLTHAPLAPDDPDGGVGRALLWGFLGGAVTGIGFLPVAFVLFFLTAFGLAVFANLASFIFLLFGIPVAAIAGGLLGATFGLLDALVYRAATAFVA
ncbi:MULTISPECIES: hypothetical protein [unclassified Haladaptatus]|uniref:hypothetical protein n=1 Tax=unclassified Haladaptatus TaxID=2622732 RepID=UPI0023E8A65B|nr:MULTISPECIES: hypothetical protein [unclassified Haladaptatus]